MAQIPPPRHAMHPLCNYSVRFSPFEANKLVLAQSQNFGIVGAGAVSIMQTGPGAGPM
jgi:hypothetical protein